MFDFAIRDDDTNYHTDPDDLERAHGSHDLPVSLGVVPFHGCTRSPAIPQTYWYEEDVEFPVGENDDLVEYLRGGLEDGSYSVVLHGYDHVRTPSGAEFDRPGGLRRKVRDGRDYLEELFGDVSAFAPPDGAFCRKGLEAVKIGGMDAFYYPTPRDRPRDLEAARLLGTELSFELRHRFEGPLAFAQDAYRLWGLGDRSVPLPVRPFPYHVGGGWEFTDVSLIPSSNVERIRRQMELADELDGGFCLSVNYWNFEDERFVRKFEELVGYAREELDPNFVHCGELFP